MAIRERIRSGVGQLPIPDPIMVKKDGTINNVGLSQIKQAVQAISRAINGMISLGNGATATWAGNIDAQYIDVAFPAVANTEIEIPHGLGRVVVGYLAVRKSQAANVYESDAGSWNTERLLLKCNTAGTTIRLLIW